MTKRNSSTRAATRRTRTERSEVAPAEWRKLDALGGTSAFEGCEPSNTQPCNSITLRQGVDSLYLSFYGNLSEEGAIRLDVARESARSTDDSNESQAQISVLDHLFEAAPTGGKLFRYRLSDHAYSIQLKGLTAAKKLPMAHVQIRSGHLMAVGVKQAVSQLRLILSFFGMVDGPAHISRIDICADFVSDHKICLLDTPGWVTRAAHIDPHIVSGQFTGWNIGRGAVTARLYDKTEEIKASGKSYMLSIWRENGWDGLSPVYRAEFQFRGEALKQFNCATYPDVLEHLGGLWRYASQDWCRLTVPNPDDETKSRWPTHHLWAHVQGIEWCDDLPLTRVSIPIGLLPSDIQLFRGFFSSLTSFMAARKITDADEGWNRLYLEGREHYEDRSEFQNAGFYDQARLRAAKKAIGYGVAYPGATEEAQRKQDEAVADAYRKRSGR